MNASTLLLTATSLLLALCVVAACGGEPSGAPRRGLRLQPIETIPGGVLPVGIPSDTPRTVREPLAAADPLRPAWRTALDRETLTIAIGGRPFAEALARDAELAAAWASALEHPLVGESGPMPGGSTFRVVVETDLVGLLRILSARAAAKAPPPPGVR